MTVSSNFFREGRVFGQLAHGAFAGVDLCHHLIGVGDGGVQVVIERVVFEQLSGAPLPSFRSLVILSSRSTASIGAGVKRVVGDQLAQRAFAVGNGAGDCFKIGGDLE